MGARSPKATRFLAFPESRGPVGEYDFEVFLGHNYSNYSKLTLNGHFSIQTN